VATQILLPRPTLFADIIMKFLVRVIALAVLAIPRLASGQAPLRYIGTATNAQLPASPVRIELSFFTRSDTISVGWMGIDAPLNGSGVVYGFAHPDSTILVSISPKGDTIRWHSPASSGTLGGEYSVLGGASGGQSGTWTLTPQPNPPKTILLFAAVVLGVGGVLALLFLARKYQQRWWVWRLSHGPIASESETKSLSGVGGWMLWHLLGVGLVGLYMLITVREVGEQVGSGVWMLNDVISYARPVLMLESAAHIFQLTAFLLGLYLVVRRRPETPLYFAFVLTSLAIYGVLDLVFSSGMADQVGAKLGKAFASDVDSEITKAATSNLRLALFGVIWAAYWIKSKRVAVMFGPAGARSSAPAEQDLNAPLPA
jgi:hypothetical protein